MTREARPLPNLDERLAAMRTPPDDPECAFHAVTLTADAQGRVSFGMFTEWVGLRTRLVACNCARAAQ